MSNLSQRFHAVDTRALTDTIEAVIGAQGVGFQTKYLPRRNGQAAWLQYTLDADQRIFGDQIKPRVLLKNANNGTSALHLAVGFLRLVCSNGMMAGQSVYRDRVVHIKGPRMDDFLENVADRVAAALEFSLSGQMGIQLEAQLARPVASVIPIVERLELSRSAEEAVISAWQLRRPEDTATLWGFWNVLNETLRRRGRSEWADAERNFTMLDRVLEAAA